MIAMNLRNQRQSHIQTGVWQWILPEHPVYLQIVIANKMEQETDLIKYLRNTAAIATTLYDDPFSARTQTLWWKAADEIERLQKVVAKLEESQNP